MQIIELDATKWKSITDFYGALLPSIGAPAEHGKNTDALVDSIIWGGLNAVEPPYTIRICGTATLPKDVRDHIELAKQALGEGRMDYQRSRGGDVGVAIEIAS